jgi:hypothetical protein
MRGAERALRDRGPLLGWRRDVEARVDRLLVLRRELLPVVEGDEIDKIIASLLRAIR